MTSTRQRLRTTMVCLGLGLGMISTSACGEDDEGGDPVADTSGGESSTETGLGIASEGSGDTDETDTEDTAETGELMGCAAIDDVEACLAEPGCGPTMGALLLDDGDGGLCRDGDEGFVGCASTSELCPPLPKTLCDGETLWQTNGCVPGNVTPCEAPAQISGPC